jgi:hypothetical protein
MCGTAQGRKPLIYAHRRHTVWFAKVVLFMPRPAQDPQENHLLAALSPLERERLYPLLRLVPMPLGEVLYESGDILRDVYFPTDSIVSLLYVLADDARRKAQWSASEGLIGIALFMGVKPLRVEPLCKAPATLTG